MRFYDPDYNWRIKLGGPEERNPLSVPGKIGNHYDRERPLTPRMAVRDDSTEAIREEPLDDADYEEFQETGKNIISRNQSNLFNPAFNFERSEGEQTHMIHYIQVGNDATVLSNNGRGSVEFAPHNVDVPGEHLSIAQIADMWLQFAENGSEALDPSHWNDREIRVHLSPDYAQELADENKDDYNLDHLFSVYGDILREEENPRNAVETYQDSYLPTRFSIAEVDMDEEFYGEQITEMLSGHQDSTAYLLLDQDPEEILENDYQGPVNYSSQNLDTVEEHLGLAGLAEKWFEIGTTINRKS